jgi:signal transduction histidine kinase
VELATCPEERLSFDALIAAARRVTGSEAAVLVLAETGGALRLDTHLGLERRELEALSEAIAAGDRSCVSREFAGVLEAEIVVDGETVGFIAVLRRGAQSFDHEDLIRTFATQVGLCLAVARRPPAYDEMLETWAVLDRLVLSAHSLGELGRALKSVIGPLFGDARIGVMIADRQRSVLQMMPGAFGAADDVAASHRVNFLDPRSNSARVLTTGLPYISNASAGDQSIRQDYVDVFGLHRVLTVPLGNVGVLHIADGRHEFDLDDLERADALSPRIASIVELAAALYQARREQRVEETICRAAVAVASGDSIHTVMEPSLRELCEATEADVLAFVPDDAPPVLVSSGRRDPELERAMLAEAGTEPGIRAYVVGPQRAGDPGYAAFYVPVTLRGLRIGTLASLRLHGEPFAQAERRSFMRMANVAALNYTTELYQQQRAELARLQERQRLADDLHDDVAQILFAAQLRLDSILEQDEVSDEVAERIARARGLLIRGDTAIRTVINKLSSPPATDIGARLASVVSGVEVEFALPIHLHVDETVTSAARGLRRPVGDVVIRAAREALVNAAKHAGRCRVTVRLELDLAGGLRLTIADDGLGALTPRPGGGHGLTAVGQLVLDQGGRMQVEHGDAGGTTVTVTVPVGDDPQPAPSGDGSSDTAVETVAA